MNRYAIFWTCYPGTDQSGMPTLLMVSAQNDNEALYFAEMMLIDDLVKIKAITVTQLKTEQS